MSLFFEHLVTFSMRTSASAAAEELPGAALKFSSEIPEAYTTPACALAVIANIPSLRYFLAFTKCTYNFTMFEQHWCISLLARIAHL